MGALLDPDLERILSLRPDLVVVYRSQTDCARSSGGRRIPVFVYRHAGLADVTATMRRLGERIGSGPEAERLATNIERRIEAVRAASAKAGAVRGRWWSSGATRCAARNLRERRGRLHPRHGDAAGGDNVFADVKREAVQATTELILARAPDVILELRAAPMDRAAKEKEVAHVELAGAVPAVRIGRVHILDDARTVVPGPRVAEAPS